MKQAFRLFIILTAALLFTACGNARQKGIAPDVSVPTEAPEAPTSSTASGPPSPTEKATEVSTEAKIIVYAPEPFDVNAGEYRFMYENLECVIDLEYFEIEPDEFDIREIEEYPFKDDVDYPNKRPITSPEEATVYGVEIFMQHGWFTSDEPTWLLLAVMRDEVNDAWGVSFSPAPLCPGLGVEYTFYSDGGGIVSSYYE